MYSMVTRHTFAECQSIASLLWRYALRATSSSFLRAVHASSVALVLISPVVSTIDDGSREGMAVAGWVSIEVVVLSFRFSEARPTLMST